MRKRKICESGGKDVFIDIPETKWEEYKLAIHNVQLRGLLIQAWKDRFYDYPSIVIAYFKHIGKAFMYFIKAFNRKPLEFRDYIPYKSIRLCKIKEVKSTGKAFPGSLDHFKYDYE